MFRSSLRNCLHKYKPSLRFNSTVTESSEPKIISKIYVKDKEWILYDKHKPGTEVMILIEGHNSKQIWREIRKEPVFILRNDNEETKFYLSANFNRHHSLVESENGMTNFYSETRIIPADNGSLALAGGAFVFFVLFVTNFC